MNAIIVSVNYQDILAITLPYNRHHFERVLVVTTPSSEDGTAAVANGCEVFATAAFHDNGAVFNKFKALEQGLDVLGREGWLCLMDADVLWPKDPLLLNDSELVPGFLHTPRRRMWDSWPQATVLDVRPFEGTGIRLPNSVPPEHLWSRFPLHRNDAEFAGYSQIFHASDPVLGPAPWHETDYTHAGAADSWFQQKWPAERKVRPPWECLHLGPAGQNWYGRATPLADGTVPDGAAEKRARVMTMWAKRDERRRRGLDPFAEEKLPR